MSKLLTFFGASAVLLSTSADTPDMVGMPSQKDRDLAAVWTGLVAETNSPLGTLNLTNIGADAISGRIQELKVQAEKGVAEAQFALAYCYNVGLGVPQDFAETLNGFGGLLNRAILPQLTFWGMPTLKASLHRGRTMKR